jgi:hypothetical protein
MRLAITFTPVSYFDVQEFVCMNFDVGSRMQKVMASASPFGKPHQQSLSPEMGFMVFLSILAIFLHAIYWVASQGIVYFFEELYTTRN